MADDVGDDIGNYAVGEGNDVGENVGGHVCSYVGDDVDKPSPVACKRRQQLQKPLAMLQAPSPF